MAGPTFDAARLFVRAGVPRFSGIGSVPTESNPLPRKRTSNSGFPRSHLALNELVMTTFVAIVEERRFVTRLSKYSTRAAARRYRQFEPSGPSPTPREDRSWLLSKPQKERPLEKSPF